MIRSVLPLVIVLTVGASFFCSLCESIILSTTIAEIEALKRTRPRRAALLETLKREIDATISAITSGGTGVSVVIAIAARRSLPVSPVSG